MWIESSNTTQETQANLTNTQESQSNNTLTKDSPLFIYIQDYKLNFITKLKDKQTTIKIPLDTTITKDKYNNINLQDTKLLFLSFIPFKDNDEANNTKAQKIQIESKDLEKQSITKQFKIPIIEDFKENEVVRGWRGETTLRLRECIGNLLRETYLGSYLTEYNFVYSKEIDEQELIAICKLSLAEVFVKVGIERINNLEVQSYYDDWYIYGILASSEYFYNVSFGLLKMRENEYPMGKINKDSSEPGIAVSFISFDMQRFVECLSKKNYGEIGSIIDYPIYAKDRKKYDEILRKYFGNANSVGGYFIAELYIKKILSINSHSNIYLTPSIKSNNRIQKFLEEQNRIKFGIYDIKHNSILIDNPTNPTLLEKNIILATHTGNVNMYSFAAEIKFHADALLDSKSYMNKWYHSAIIADMGVSEGYTISFWQDYYELNSQLVKEQMQIHQTRIENGNYNFN